MFNRTGFLEHVLVKNYLKDSEEQMLALQARLVPRLTLNLVSTSWRDGNGNTWLQQAP